jgi:hypothetical protein
MLIYRDWDTTVALLASSLSAAVAEGGYRIWPDNYGMFLEQIDPNGTSHGYWRVGSKDQPYGRFARGFRHADGKDVMAFRLESGFFTDPQPAEGRAVTIRVVYFDKGRGQWALKYDAVDDRQKTAMVVHKTDSGSWKEAIATIVDGRFARRGPKGADLLLVNLDDEDDVFHMIELRRGK